MTRNLEPGLEPQAHVRVRMYRYSGATQPPTRPAPHGPYDIETMTSLMQLMFQCDADLGGNKDNGHSQTSYLGYLAGSLICWCSTDQGSVSTSSAESEIKAVNHVTCMTGLQVHSASSVSRCAIWPLGSASALLGLCPGFETRLGRRPPQCYHLVETPLTAYGIRPAQGVEPTHPAENSSAWEKKRKSE
jgi:hypothetical protein